MTAICFLRARICRAPEACTSMGNFLDSVNRLDPHLGRSRGGFAGSVIGWLIQVHAKDHVTWCK